MTSYDLQISQVVEYSYVAGVASHKTKDEYLYICIASYEL